ncbi:MAG: hypothetical protein ACI84C_002638 [Flavobacteriales bacterium]|jgi:hypothetical protein
MGLNQHNIDLLVDKFWKGETSLEEEAALSDYFTFNEVPDKYEGVASYFALLGEEDDALGHDFDSKILDEIQGKTKKGGAVVFFKPFFQAVAAIAAIFVIGFFVATNTDDPTGPSAASVIHENVLQDPNVFEAFEQTRSALFLVSSKLNKGHEQSLKLSKFNDAQQNLKSDSDEKDN